VIRNGLNIRRSRCAGNLLQAFENKDVGFRPGAEKINDKGTQLGRIRRA